ncbi:MAG: endonuclease/exonuclease/phosphatase family protein [Arcicella sp.]|nr:endonuclease/exonuclease/phosphatase family protein [Arcicella sp.]
MKELTFLFWNTNKNTNFIPVKDIIEHYDVDVIILAECDFKTQELVVALNEKKALYFDENGLAQCEKIKIITKFPPKFLVPILEDNRYSIRTLSLPLLDSILIVGIHLPDKGRSSSDNQLLASRSLYSDIEKMESEHKSEKTIIIGDFNMNPFENGMVSMNGLNAVMSESIAMTGSRIVQDREFKYFYNPMWSLYGDVGNNVPGSYFYRKNENLPWNVFDQVLLRPALIPNFDKSSLTFLDSIGTESLLSKSGYPDKKFSDHLPLIFKLKLNKKL